MRQKELENEARKKMWTLKRQEEDAEGAGDRDAGKSSGPVRVQKKGSWCPCLMAGSMDKHRLSGDKRGGRAHIARRYEDKRDIRIDTE